MAKGDKSKQQNIVDYEKERNRNLQTNQLEQAIIPQNQTFWNQYTSGSAQAEKDYRDIMDQYKNFQATAPERATAERVNYSRSPEMAHALQGYGEFADTGGFSQADIANMRARGISPIRAMYSNAQNEIARQTNLQGGYSPNKGALLAKMAMGKNQQIADQVTDVEARLAEMRNQGRLAGLGGLGNLSVSDTAFGQQAALANQDAALRASQLNANSIDPLRLSAIHGQTQMFGQAPGMAQMYANNLMNSNNQWANNNAQQMANSGMAMQGQQMAANTPSNFEVGLGRVGQIGGMAAQIAAPFMVPGMPPIPSSRVPGASGTYGSLPSAGPSQGAYTPYNPYAANQVRTERFQF